MIKMFFAGFKFGFIAAVTAIFIWFFVGMAVFSFRHPFVPREIAVKFYVVEAISFDRITYSQHEETMRGLYQ